MELQRQMNTLNGREDAALYAGGERYKFTDRIEARVLEWSTKYKLSVGSMY